MQETVHERNTRFNVQGFILTVKVTVHFFGKQKCFLKPYDFKNKTTYKSFLDDRTVELIKMRINSSNDINDKLIYKEGVHDLQRWISRRFKIIFDNLFNNGSTNNEISWSSI